jgi:hypothetical protein
MLCSPGAFFSWALNVNANAATKAATIRLFI